MAIQFLQEEEYKNDTLATASQDFFERVKRLMLFISSARVRPKHAYLMTILRVDIVRCGFEVWVHLKTARHAHAHALPASKTRFLLY